MTSCRAGSRAATVTTSSKGSSSFGTLPLEDCSSLPSSQSGSPSPTQSVGIHEPSLHVKVLAGHSAAMTVARRAASSHSLLILSSGKGGYFFTGEKQERSEESSFLGVAKSNESGLSEKTKDDEGRRGDGDGGPGPVEGGEPKQGIIPNYGMKMAGNRLSGERHKRSGTVREKEHKN